MFISIFPNCPPIKKEKVKTIYIVNININKCKHFLKMTKDMY